ncbi:hypothetical protein PISMIDRAFT_57703, partial [Pisolithus microcarpus 441]
LHTQGMGQYPPKFIAQGLHPTFSPFWSDLLHSDIFVCISSDILRQLHQGIFKDHLKQWCIDITGKQNLNTCFGAMSHYPGLHHWSDSISKIKQWTGSEHKQLQWVFVSSLIGTTTHSDVVRASQVLLDFIYIVQYQSQTDGSIVALCQALNSFHDMKEVF